MAQDGPGFSLEDLPAPLQSSGFGLSIRNREDPAWPIFPQPVSTNFGPWPQSQTWNPFLGNQSLPPDSLL